MGVPKFFRYISERYPCLSQLVLESDIPEFDNLYLDMNGIIHNCSHPGDYDPHFRISEEKIFKDIFHYIEVLFRIIKPQELFFMAVDGVAPRAKMNQQRGRRFRSAKETEDRDKDVLRKGGQLPEDQKFDSNCITPGTSFMARLQAQLKFFVSMKISTDKSWQKVKVILSGHECPGEGEHKIMDYIRYLRAQSDYNPNTRHCLYGLDADLIMLGLCTHEPHFALLREEVKFGKKLNKKMLSPEETKFFLLHLSLMREYLEMEFCYLKGVLPFEFNLENIIDDWVLMGFLVGNDFIPNLPGLHISSGALPALYKVYCEILPTLDGYINEGGTLNLARFEAYMKKLASYDIKQFRERYDDLKYIKSKVGSGSNPTAPNATGGNTGLKRQLQPFFQDDDEVVEEELDGVGTVKKIRHITINDDSSNGDTNNEDFEQAVQDMIDLDDDNGSDYYDEDDKEADRLAFFHEFCSHKQNYYQEKLDYKKITPNVLRAQAEGYVTAIQWNLNYYYNGLCSWSWYFPHHYAPYISDIQNFKDMKIEFELGKPFLPFEQLLAVLPAFSKELLPKPFQELMTYENSPIFDYYPVNFQTDLNGKKNEWEAVVLVPFIDEERLLQAMEACYHRLTDEEKQRNKHGPMHVYTYSADSLGRIEAPAYFSPIEKNYALDTPLYREELIVPKEKLQKKLLPGVLLDVYFPGFPTFKHLEYTSELRHEGVRIFQSASQCLNMIVKVNPLETRFLHDNLVEQYMNRIMHVNWPYLLEAKVVAIKSTKKETSIETGVYKSSDREEKDKVFATEVRVATQELLKSRGIDAGKVDFLVMARPLEGSKFDFIPNQTGGMKVEVKKKWSNTLRAYPLQLVIKEVITQTKAAQNVTVDDIFPVGSNCFLLNPRHYGCLGIVNEKAEDGLVRVKVTAPPEPEMDDIRIRRSKLRYYTNTEAAQRVCIPNHLLARITGTVLVLDTDDPSAAADKCPKVNIGLNLKFSRRNQQLPGYTKRLENNQWLYSDNTVQLVREYAETFPEVIRYLAKNSDRDLMLKSDIFPLPGQSHMLSVISNWLDSRTELKVERRRCDADILEPDEIVELESKIEQFMKKNKRGRIMNIKVKPFHLYTPSSQVEKQGPDYAEFHLLDRVVNVRDNFIVPLGYKGTVIGLEKQQDDSNIVQCDVLFDQTFTAASQYNTKKKRVYRLADRCLLNSTFAKEKFARDEARRDASTLQKQPSSQPKKPTNTVPSKPAVVKVRQHAQADIRGQQLPLPAKAGANSFADIPPLIHQPFTNTSQSGGDVTSSRREENPTDISAIFKMFSKQSAQPANVEDENKKTEIKIPPKNTIIKVGTEEPTLALKKMLRISADKENVPSATQSGQNASSKEKEGDAKGYVLELQELFEKAGKEIPRYDYQYVDGNFRATLFLPGVDIGICGDVAATKKLAGEKAAFIILSFLQLVQNYGDHVLAVMVNEITLKELNAQLIRLQQRLQELREPNSSHNRYFPPQYGRPTPSQDVESFFRPSQNSLQITEISDSNQSSVPKTQHPMQPSVPLLMGPTVMRLSPSQFSAPLTYPSQPQFQPQISQQRQVTFASNYYCHPQAVPPTKYPAIPQQLYYQNVQNIIYSNQANVRPNFPAGLNNYQGGPQWGPTHLMFPPQMGYPPPPAMRPQVPFFNDRMPHQGPSLTLDKPVPQNVSYINSNHQSNFKSFNSNNQNSQKLFTENQNSPFASPYNSNGQNSSFIPPSNNSNNSFVPICNASQSDTNFVATSRGRDSNNSFIQSFNNTRGQNTSSMPSRPPTSNAGRASKTPKKNRLAANFSKMTI